MSRFRWRKNPSFQSPPIRRIRTSGGGAYSSAVQLAERSVRIASPAVGLASQAVRLAYPVKRLASGSLQVRSRALKLASSAGKMRNRGVASAARSLASAAVRLTSPARVLQYRARRLSSGARRVAGLARPLLYSSRLLRSKGFRGSRSSRRLRTAWKRAAAIASRAIRLGIRRRRRGAVRLLGIRRLRAGAPIAVAKAIAKLRSAQRELLALKTQFNALKADFAKMSSV
jgi:hypothetical protein